MNLKQLTFPLLYSAMAATLPDIETTYNPNVYKKSELTKKQKKARTKSKNAKQARRK